MEETDNVMKSFGLTKHERMLSEQISRVTVKPRSSLAVPAVVVTCVPSVQ